ncbi:polysaccharide deacetylase family protein [uncultured Clostridium sp.]|jgi:peptidoglycan-N-acetylmuramic acid deacetylase|uniref:polysaccharide deacetylase family protein n=1 Tax=uncultured Clostridium sp. TaxID=59620 RepID=UPI0026366C6F|nr:polysaccharide deacetylase family protein [uncultured Clostridium sp.]
MFNFLMMFFSIIFLASPLNIFASPTTVNNTELNWYYSFDKNLNTLTSPKEAPFLNDNLALFKGNENEKVLYLTFDEGYEQGYTNKIIDILNDNKVPAAFFVTKYYMSKEPDIVKKMHSTGHLVCNHSNKHKSMPTLIGSPAFESEFKDTEKTFKEITGENMPIYFRPPMGKYSHKSLVETNKLGYISVFWTFAYKDWLVDNQPTPDVAFKKITSNIHNGQILLLHACSKTNTDILDRLLKHLKAEGYRFESLDYLSKSTKSNT